jgi:1,4-alpha-glucan branching enzyme
VTVLNDKQMGQVQSMMTQARVTFQAGGLHRYSAKRMTKPVNFFCYAPEAQQVVVLGDFNEWRADANPMQRQSDGGWVVQVPLHHGHHLYLFLVDGKPVLDPRAQGIARNARNERVSMVAVS